jgi:hypothetical protein
MDAVAAIGMGMQGSLEEQLSRYGNQAVTKRRRLSLLINRALVYTSPKAVGYGGLRGLSQLVSCTQGAQINFGDLPPYLTYEGNVQENF